MGKEKLDNSKEIQEKSNKKLDEIISHSKAENEALNKILEGLKKLEKENNQKTSKKGKNKR